MLQTLLKKFIPRAFCKRNFKWSYILSGVSDPLYIEWYVWSYKYWVVCLILYILSGMSDPLYIEWYV